MPSLSAVATPDQFTSSGGGGASTGGGSLPSSGGGIPGLSTVHNVAQQFVDSVENRLGQKLAQISQLAKTDPASAQAQLIDAWTEYLSASEQFAGSNVMGQRIVAQSLGNTKLTQTVQSLWNETGGQGGFDMLNSAVAQKSGGTVGTKLITLLPTLVALAGLTIKATSATPKPPASSTGNGAGTTEPPTGTGTGGSEQEKPSPEVQSWLQKYAPWVLTGISAGANIWGASQASAAAKEAAGIQAEAANRSTELNRQIYNQNRSDQMPWLNLGTSATFRLSDLLGLPPSARTMPSTQGVGSLSAVSGVTPTPSPTEPPANPNVPAGLDFGGIAQQYKRARSQGAA